MKAVVETSVRELGKVLKPTVSVLEEPSADIVFMASFPVYVADLLKGRE